MESVADSRALTAILIALACVRSRGASEADEERTVRLWQPVQGEMLQAILIGAQDQQAGVTGGENSLPGLQVHLAGDPAHSFYDEVSRVIGAGVPVTQYSELAARQCNSWTRQ